MTYWLFKSEPNTFNIEDLIKSPKQTTHWNGIRNYQVRNMLRDDIKVGDKVFFYYSNCQPPGIVGVMEVTKAGYPDFTAYDKKSDYYDSKSSEQNPIWYMVDVKFVKKFPNMISLDDLKKMPDLKEMIILKKGNRLSITPVTSKEWQAIEKLAK